MHIRPWNSTPAKTLELHPHENVRQERGAAGPFLLAFFRAREAAPSGAANPGCSF